MSESPTSPLLSEKESKSEKEASRPIRYKQLTINLATARSNKKHELAGYNLSVLRLSSGALCQIKFNNTTGEAIELSKVQRVESHFERFYITNTAQTGKTITLIIGEENFKCMPFPPVVPTSEGGTKTIQKAADVAGNVVTTKTVPTGKRWLLLNLCFTLTTDATVVNRYCQVKTQDSADALKFENISDATAASSTEYKKFSRGLSTTGQAINGLGSPLLSAGEDVVLTISGGVAGDKYTYLLEYLESDEP